MGSPFGIIFYHTDSAEARQVARQCFELVDSLNLIFSDYDSSSEISRLNYEESKQPQKISISLFEVIMISLEAERKSGRTFSVYAGALTKLWRNARQANTFPARYKVRQARRLSSKKHFKFFPQDSTMVILSKGASMDFGGIVKGYTAQKVIDHLKINSIRHALVDAGGDIVMSKSPPGTEGWSIAIHLPGEENEFTEQHLFLNNMAVATSGNMYQFIEYKDKKYSHIIDPKTGYGITEQRQVTVIAKDGTTADWLATACSILPVKKALRLAESEQASLLIIETNNGKISIHRSANFNRNYKLQ